MRGRIAYGRDGTREYRVNGELVTEEKFAELFPPKSIGGVPGGLATTGWPLNCTALGVHESQVEQANARNKRHGIHTRYDRTGQAIVPDAADYKRLQRLEGVHNKDDFC